MPQWRLFQRSNFAFSVPGAVLPPSIRRWSLSNDAPSAAYSPLDEHDDAHDHADHGHDVDHDHDHDHDHDAPASAPASASAFAVSASTTATTAAAVDVHDLPVATADKRAAARLLNDDHAVTMATTAAEGSRRWSLAAPGDYQPAGPTRPRRRPRPLHIPRLSHPSSVLPSTTPLAQLQAHVPLRFRDRDWQLVYSTMRHGVSLATFFARCPSADPMILVIRDAHGAVFGCYSSVPWRPSKTFFGSGEGFVFTLAPEVRVFKWTKSNSFFQLASADQICVGGGGKFAIFLDAMLEHGSSGFCATFHNPCLASSDQFDVVVVEAYKLLTPSQIVNDDDETF